jgi:hypothetical protein
MLKYDPVGTSPKVSHLKLAGELRGEMPWLVMLQRQMLEFVAATAYEHDVYCRMWIVARWFG